MAYEKTNWINGETPISARNLNKIEEGIEDLHRRGDYSLEEQEIGTWMGKTLYRKTFSYTFDTTIESWQGVYQFAESINPVEAQGSFINGIEWYPFFSTTRLWYFNTSDNTFYVRHNAEWMNGLGGYITLEYTKNN